MNEGERLALRDHYGRRIASLLEGHGDCGKAEYIGGWASGQEDDGSSKCGFGYIVEAREPIRTTMRLIASSIKDRVDCDRVETEQFAMRGAGSACLLRIEGIVLENR